MLELVKKHRKSIMGVSALSILIFHCNIGWFVKGSGVIWYFEHFLLSCGFIGVDFFFLMSGIGLVHSINKNSLKKYYINRLSRLLFPVLLIAIIYIPFKGWTFISFIKNVTGYNFFIYIYSFLWFIYAIAIIYIAFPLYYYLYKKIQNKKIATILSLLLWFIIAKLLENNLEAEMFKSFVCRIPVFLVGVLFGQMQIDNEEIPINNVTLLIISGGGALFGCVFRAR